jgi:transposase
MGAAASLTSTAETKHRTPRQGSSHGAKRHPLAPPDGCTLARLTLPIWSLANRCQPLLSLATSRSMAARPANLATAGGCSWTSPLGSALCGFHGYSGPSACGRSKRGQQQQALGRSRGGFSTKIHLRAEGCGKPVVFTLTAGQRHEQEVFEDLLEEGYVKRPRQGRPRIRPKRVVGDKGYSSCKARRYLQRRGIGAVIPRRTYERRGSLDKERYRERNRVERLINRLKQFRRVATRYEKLAANYLTILTIAAIVIWL